MRTEVGFVRADFAVLRVKGCVARLLTAALFVCAGTLGIGVSSASARPSGYFVTFVARSCPAYSDIFANKARNDILESLEDLGPDTQYDDSGQLVNPTAEGIPPQDVCTPLVGWEFTLGTGYQSHAVTGPWGSLSIVTNPFPRAPIVTQAQTPLLNQNALPVGKQKLAGAVTIELTSQERAQASQASQLWAQGGTPTDPDLAQKFPGPAYGFGGLRCATDNLNGDNVEYVFFPAGVRHVFCYGLYVTPPPTSGTITIQKQVTGAPAGDNPRFPFNGSISYDPSGFQLGAGGSEDFYRAGGVTWTVTESAVADYKLADLSCSAEAAGGARGASTADISGATASIHLVAGEHVTCVYTNRYVPPSGGLTIRKLTTGGVGQFGYTVTPVSGHGSVRLARATTTQPNVAVDAQPSLLNLAPGRYRISESKPTSSGGDWRLVRVRCDGASRSTTQPVEVDIPSWRGGHVHVHQCVCAEGFDRAREDHRGWHGYRVVPRFPRARVSRPVSGERDDHRPRGRRRRDSRQRRGCDRSPAARGLLDRRAAARGRSRQRLDADDRQVRRRARAVRPGRRRGEADARAPQVALRVHGHLLDHPAAAATAGKPAAGSSLPPRRCSHWFPACPRTSSATSLSPNTRQRRS